MGCLKKWPWIVIFQLILWLFKDHESWDMWSVCESLCLSYSIIHPWRRAYRVQSQKLTSIINFSVSPKAIQNTLVHKSTILSTKYFSFLVRNQAMNRLLCAMNFFVISIFSPVCISALAQVAALQLTRALETRKNAHYSRKTSFCFAGPQQAATYVFHMLFLTINPFASRVL